MFLCGPRDRASWLLVCVLVAMQHGPKHAGGQRTALGYSILTLAGQYYSKCACPHLPWTHKQPPEKPLYDFYTMQSAQ
jgi:hypothetical protein